MVDIGPAPSTAATATGLPDARWHSLPADLLASSFAWLPLQIVFKCSRVCKYWQSAAFNELTRVNLEDSHSYRAVKPFKAHGPYTELSWKMIRATHAFQADLVAWAANKHELRSLRLEVMNGPPANHPAADYRLAQALLTAVKSSLQVLDIDCCALLTTVDVLPQLRTLRLPQCRELDWRQLTPQLQCLRMACDDVNTVDSQFEDPVRFPTTLTALELDVHCKFPSRQTWTKVAESVTAGIKRFAVHALHKSTKVHDHVLRGLDVLMTQWRLTLTTLILDLHHADEGLPYYQLPADFLAKSMPWYTLCQLEISGCQWPSVMGPVGAPRLRRLALSWCCSDSGVSTSSRSAYHTRGRARDEDGISSGPDDESNGGERMFQLYVHRATNQAHGVRLAAFRHLPRLVEAEFDHTVLHDPNMATIQQWQTRNDCHVHLGHNVTLLTSH